MTLDELSIKLRTLMCFNALRGREVVCINAEGKELEIVRLGESISETKVVLIVKEQK
jgi:hypothetical protein